MPDIIPTLATYSFFQLHNTTTCYHHIYCTSIHFPKYYIHIHTFSSKWKREGGFNTLLRASMSTLYWPVQNCKILPMKWRILMSPLPTFLILSWSSSMTQSLDNVYDSRLNTSPSYRMQSNSCIGLTEPLLQDH